MERKRIWSVVVAISIAIGLVYLQYHFWQEFDWRTFWIETGRAKMGEIAGAVALIYFAYLVLAFRWKVLLQPVCRSSITRIFPPTAVGFTGLVLLGRPGDLIRPYLIARNERVSFSSQLAIWVVERLFDLLAAALLIATGLLASPAWDPGGYLERLRAASAILFAVVLGMLAATFFLRGRTEMVGRCVQSACRWVKHDLGDRLARKGETFGNGLCTVDTISSFLKVTALSLLLWMVNAVAYWLVIRAYPEPLSHFGLVQAAVLMGFGIVGSVIQLPAVGGGAQLVTVAALVRVFGVPKELAVSCGIALWLVSFASIVPLGLVLGHREGVSLRKLSQASGDARKDAEAHSIVEEVTGLPASGSVRVN
jgi:glycosyltransferase 2 family protein